MAKRTLVLVLVLALWLVPAVRAAEESAPVSLTAASALLMEPQSGQVIWEKNADERRPVASVTKIMAILLACEAVEQGRCSLDDVVNVSKQASGMGGSQVLLDTGEQQPFRLLLKSMIVASANDATVAVGEYLYGSERAFVARMNQRAQELGLENTHFANSTGLPAQDHYTSARDVAMMSRELVKHPLYFEFSTIWMDTLDHGDGRVTQLTNTNRLTRLYDGCDGIKTGSTNEAGYCMSASAVRGDMRLIAVVLASKTSSARFSEAQALLDYGFANYRTYTAAQKGARVKGAMPVTGGERDSLALELGEDLTLLIAKGEEQAVELVPRLPQWVPAPIYKGQQVGTLEVQLGGRLLGQVPVVASEAVARNGFLDGWQRVLDHWF